MEASWRDEIIGKFNEGNTEPLDGYIRSMLATLKVDEVAATACCAKVHDLIKQVRKAIDAKVERIEIGKTGRKYRVKRDQTTDEIISALSGYVEDIAKMQVTGINFQGRTCSLRAEGAEVAILMFFKEHAELILRTAIRNVEKTTLCDKCAKCQCQERVTCSCSDKLCQHHHICQSCKFCNDPICETHHVAMRNLRTLAKRINFNINPIVSTRAINAESANRTLSNEIKSACLLNVTPEFCQLYLAPDLEKLEGKEAFRYDFNASTPDNKTIWIESIAISSRCLFKTLHEYGRKMTCEMMQMTAQNADPALCAYYAKGDKDEDYVFIPTVIWDAAVESGKINDEKIRKLRSKSSLAAAHAI